MEETAKKSGLGIASLVLGIIGVCTAFIPIINNVSFVLGIIGAVLGAISLAKKTSKGQAIAGVVLCVLAIVITINSQKTLSDTIDNVANEVNSTIDTATGKNTKEVLANYLDVSIGDFKVEKDGYITNTKLVVTLKNKSSETKSFDVKIEAVDKNRK